MRMRSKNAMLQPGRRAMATTVVVGMLGLIAAAALALTVLVATEIRRTRDARVHAQQRQLLLAGAAEAQQRAASVTLPVQEIPLPLPAALAPRAALTLAFSPAEKGTRTATIKATVDGQTMRQFVTLAESPTHTWRITAAKLEGMQ